MPRKYLILLKNILAEKSNIAIDWKLEIWPFQWRIAISWMFGYLIFFLFNPIMFYYHGAVIAGQMGLTITLVNNMSTVGNLLFQTKIPQMGIFIAQKQYKLLDNYFYEHGTIAFVIGLLGGVVSFAAIYGLYISGSAFSARLLPPLPTGMFILAAILNNILFLQSTYLRAHKVEPLMWATIGGGLLIGFSTWLLGAKFGAIGAATGFLAITSFFGLPVSSIIFIKKRHEWHS